MSQRAAYSSTNPVLCREASKALPQFRGLECRNSNFRLFCPRPDAVLVFLWYNPQAAHPTPQAADSLPWATSRPSTLNFSRHSPFLLFPCPLTDFPPSCSLTVSPHLHLLRPESGLSTATARNGLQPSANFISLWSSLTRYSTTFRSLYSWNTSSFLDNTTKTVNKIRLFLESPRS